MGRRKIRMEDAPDLDYEVVAQAYTAFQDESQIMDADKRIDEYIMYLANAQYPNLDEIIRRLAGDAEFKAQMRFAVLHLSALLTSVLVSEPQMYEEVFKIVRQHTADDLTEVRWFKLNLLETFNLAELESELGYKFSNEIVADFSRKYLDMYAYFSDFPEFHDEQEGEVDV